MLTCSGGQYHWSAILSPPKWAPVCRLVLPASRPRADLQAISWVCGWFATAGWIALVATAGSLAGGLITGAIALAHPDYEIKRWLIFVIYIAYMLYAAALNIFGLRLLPVVNKTAIIW